MMVSNTESFKKQLLSERGEWEHRLGAIRRDRRRETGPLDADWQEQAIELENDETLDGLDARGRAAIEAIDAALARIALGSYGECAVCGEAIPAARLEAQPTAVTCIGCASSGARD